MLERCPYCESTQGFKRCFIYTETQFFDFNGCYNDSIETRFVRGGKTAYCQNCGRPIEQLRKSA